MRYVMFSDESGTSPAQKCFTIGALLIPEKDVQQFEEKVLQIIEKHRIPKEREIKWERVKKSYGLINFGIDVLKLVLSSTATFTAFVGWKEHFYLWKKDEEKAFYVSYTELIKFAARTLNAEVNANIDERSNAYGKNHEVVKIIANHSLKNSLGKVLEVSQKSSKSCLLIQVADIITGAINAAHNCFIDNEWRNHPGKELLIKKLAAILGWDYLWYDTYPNANFNIWHFPWQQFRGKPKTENTNINFDVEYVSSSDLLNYLKS